jgi:Schlafen, AlbA_2
MIPKRFEDIEYSDLEALLNNQVAEGKTIEYKQVIPSNADSDKVKFLAGVSAFANTIGGDFIIGIEAEDGIPLKLSGLNFTSEDAEILRLEQMLLTGVEPRLPSFSIRGDIQSPTGEKFILVRVNRSWIAPHKVRANEKFYGRNSKGKYPMDVSELRTAFMLTEQISERIRNFYQQRVNKINKNEEIPVLLREGGKMILHLLPLVSFTTSTEFDVIELSKKMQFSPISSTGWDKRINLDGVVVARNFDTSVISYTQAFRNGCIEAVICLSWSDDDKDYSVRYKEEQIIKALSDYIEFYLDLEIELPIYVFLTLINVKDYKFHLDDDFRNINEVRFIMRGENKPVIDRNNLIIPEITINNYESSPAEILRPAFNLIWNSVGFARDFNYDNNGKWIENLRSLSRY